MAKLNLTRDQLGAFLGKDHKAIVQFEQLFTETNDISGTYLPLAGGTLTGQLFINYGIDGAPGLRVKATASGGDGMTFENSSGVELMAVDADSSNNIDFDLKDGSSNSIFKVNTTNLSFNTGVQEIDLNFYKKTSGQFITYDSSLDIFSLGSNLTTLTGDTSLTLSTPADGALLSTQSTGTVDLAIPTTKYVNDNDFWDRTGTILNPRTSTDDVEWDSFRYTTTTLGQAGNTLIGEDGPASVNSIANTAVGNSSFAGGTGNQNSAFGHSALGTSTGNIYNNAAFGAYALREARSGAEKNAAFGMSSLQSLTTGVNNTAYGYQSGLNHTTADGCVYLGYQAGYSNNTDNLLIIENSTNVTTPLIWGNFSTNSLVFNCAADLALLSTQPTGGTALAIATTKYADDNDFWTRTGTTLNPETTTDDVEWNAFTYLDATTGGLNNTLIGDTGNTTLSGDNNVFLGKTAGASVTTASSNTFLGTAAGTATTTGGSNLAFGNSALLSNTAGSFITAIGAQSARNCIASKTTAVGYQALYTSTTGNNTAVGQGAAQLSASGDSIVAIGRTALQLPTTCDEVVAVGRGCGENATGAVAGVAVGCYAGKTGNLSGSLFLGYSAGENETNANRMYLANSNTTTPLIYGEFDNSVLTINNLADTATLAVKPTGGTALAIATTEYVDDSDFWSRSGTILSPETSGDSLNIDAASIFNTDAGDNDFEIKKNTSGTAYKFDAGLATHNIDGATVTLTTPADQALLTTQPTGGTDLAISTTKYVDDNTFWDRNTTTLNPKTSTDAVEWADLSYQDATTGGTECLYLGEDCGNVGTSGGFNNLGIGSGALAALLSPNNNVCIGKDSGRFITTAANNCLLGANTGTLLTTAGFNMFIGSDAGRSATGNSNVGIGNTACRFVTGNANCYIGHNSGGAMTATTGNVGIGQRALFGASGTNAGNVAIGQESGEGISTGDYNVCIGYKSGEGLTTESDVLIIENTNDITTPLILGDFSADTLKFHGSTGSPNASTTLGAAATAIAVTRNVMTVTGDAGGNTIATITGGVDGQLLTLIFVDALVTITDDNTHGADSVDLSAAFTSADDTTLQLVYDGTSWYETSRSVN